MEEVTLQDLVKIVQDLQKTVEAQAKQIEALENQAYILYLHLNGVTKQLIEKGSLDKDQLTKDMDELNDQLYKVAQENLTTPPAAE